MNSLLRDNRNGGPLSVVTPWGTPKLVIQISKIALVTVTVVEFLIGTTIDHLEKRATTVKR